MNVENFRKVADVIEKNGEKFNMNRYFHSCGSPSCVAGYAFWLSCEGDDVKYDSVDQYEDDFLDDAMDYLGINKEQSDRLFNCAGNSVWSEKAEKYNLEQYAGGWIKDWTNIPAEMAIEILRDIADGKVKL